MCLQRQDCECIKDNLVVSETFCLALWKHGASLRWVKRNIFLPNSMETWELFNHASSLWTKLKCQLDATRWFYWCILSSTCFGHIRPSSEASDVELQHMVICTEFLDGWWSWEPLRRSCVRCGWCRAATYSSCTHDLRSGSQDHHPSKNSVQITICCNSTSNSPDDGRMYPKHVELRIHQ